MSWTCDSPGIDPLIGTLEAALSPLALPLAALVNPWQISDLDVAAIIALIILPPAMPALTLAIGIETNLKLPDLPWFPPAVDFEFDVQLEALLALSLEMSLVPLKLLISLALGEIALPDLVFPDVIIPLLPPIPAIEMLAICMAEPLEAAFTPMSAAATAAWKAEQGDDWTRPIELTFVEF